MLAAETVKITQRSTNTMVQLCGIWETTVDQEAAAKGSLDSNLNVNKPGKAW